MSGDDTIQNILVNEELLSFFDFRKKKVTKCFEDQKVISTEPLPSCLHVPALVCVRVAPHVALLYHALWKVRLAGLLVL